MKPVSVIIPTYNRSDKIISSINSVLSQTYDELELIVVDDGSDDGTDSIISQIHDSRLRYHRCDSNFGVSHARNIGVGLAGNDIIAFNDSDDVWHYDKLEKQMAYMESHPDSVLVYCPFVRALNNSEIRVPPIDRILSELEGDICKYILGSNTIGAPTVIMPKDNFAKIGAYNEQYPALEDWDFAVRAAKLGRIGYVDEVLVDVSSSSDGVSSKVDNYFKARCMMVRDHYEDICSYDLLNPIMLDILKRAENRNVLMPVKEILMLYLKETQI